MLSKKNFLLLSILILVPILIYVSWIIFKHKTGNNQSSNCKVKGPDTKSGTTPNCTETQYYDSTNNLCKTIPNDKNLLSSQYTYIADSQPDDCAPDLNKFLQAMTQSTSGTGCKIYFPVGEYHFKTPVQFTMPNRTFGITIVGDGQDTTTLLWDAVAQPQNMNAPTENKVQGMTVEFTTSSNSIQIRDLSLLTTSGFNNPATVALYMYSTPNYRDTGETTQSTVTNVSIRGAGNSSNHTDTKTAAGSFWGAGISVENIDWVNFTNVLVYGGVKPDPGKYPRTGKGVVLSSTGDVVVGSYLFTGCSFANLEYGCYIIDNPQGVAFSTCGFIDSTVGIGVGGPIGSQLEGLQASNCNFACDMHNIYVGTAVADLLLSNNLFITNNPTKNPNRRVCGADSIFITTGYRVSIMGNSFYGTNTGSEAINIKDGWKHNIESNVINKGFSDNCIVPQ